MKNIFHKAAILLFIVVILVACHKETYYQDNSALIQVLTEGVWTLDQEYLMPDPDHSDDPNSKGKIVKSRKFNWVNVFQLDNTYKDYTSNIYRPNICDYNDYIIKKSNNDKLYNNAISDVVLKKWKIQDDSIILWEKDMNTSDSYYWSDISSSYQISKYSDNYIYLQKSFIDTFIHVEPVWPADTGQQLHSTDSFLRYTTVVEFTRYYRWKNVRSKVVGP